MKLISDEMKTDEAIDALVRRKIETQKRTIVEGSDEWDVLYRKYYEDEVARAPQGDALARTIHEARLALLHE